MPFVAMPMFMFMPCNAMLSYDLHCKDQEVAAGTLLPRTGLHTERYSRCMYLIIIIIIMIIITTIIIIIIIIITIK